MKSRIISYRHSSSFELCPLHNRYIKTKTLRGMFHALFFESRGRSNFCSIFMLYPADQFCSQELNYTCEYFSGTLWLRIAWSKGSIRLGASCLKTEAEPASERLCFSLHICVARRTKSTRRKVYLYVIHHRRNRTVLKSDFYHVM